MDFIFKKYPIIFDYNTKWVIGINKKLEALGLQYMVLYDSKQAIPKWPFTIFVRKDSLDVIRKFDGLKFMPFTEWEKMNRH